MNNIRQQLLDLPIGTLIRDDFGQFYLRGQTYYLGSPDESVLIGVRGEIVYLDKQDTSLHFLNSYVIEFMPIGEAYLV